MISQSPLAPLYSLHTYIQLPHPTNGSLQALLFRLVYIHCDI
jgi:hypothetical protein